jgi:hypothetical protein
MTSLSRSSFGDPPIGSRNAMESRAPANVARRLLLGIPMICATTAEGCVVPPPLDVENPDAGASSPPVITDVVTPNDFAFPGPIIIQRGDPRSFGLTVSDNDRADTLFARMYVDYTFEAPTNFLSDCQIPSINEVLRTLQCPALRLCDGIIDTNVHALEVLVSDREFIPAGDPDATGQPAFRQVKPGGSLPVLRAWLMRCGEISP